MTNKQTNYLSLDPVKKFAMASPAAVPPLPHAKTRSSKLSRAPCKTKKPSKNCHIHVFLFTFEIPKLYMIYIHVYNF